MLRSCLHIALLLAVLRPSGALAHGSVHERLAAVERKLAESPQDASLLLQRAKLHHEHADHDKALKDLQAVGKIDPEIGDRRLLEANIHLDLGKPELALAAIDRLLGKEPKSVAGLSQRAKVLEKLGRNPEAIENARKVIEVAPAPSLEHHLFLIQLLERHGEPADVETAYAAARKNVGDFPVLLQRQAEWFAETGDRPKASEVYAELREKVPGLAFLSHVEEARLWLDHDETRARLSIKEAERVWSMLRPAVRSRDAMRAKNRELRELMD